MFRLAISLSEATNRIIQSLPYCVHVCSGKSFCIKLIIAFRSSVTEGTEKMHLINFKELTGQELGALVDLGIEVKANPKKYLKTLRGQIGSIDFPEDVHSNKSFI